MTTREERMVARLQERWSGYHIGLSQTWVARAGEPGLLVTGKYSLGVYTADWVKTVFYESNHSLELLVDQAHQSLKVFELVTADPMSASK